MGFFFSFFLFLQQAPTAGKIDDAKLFWNMLRMPCLASRSLINHFSSPTPFPVLDLSFKQYNASSPGSPLPWHREARFGRAPPRHAAGARPAAEGMRPRDWERRTAPKKEPPGLLTRSLPPSDQFLSPPRCKAALRQPVAERCQGAASPALEPGVQALLQLITPYRFASRQLSTCCSAAFPPESLLRVGHVLLN